jgi:hypothetical protein
MTLDFQAIRKALFQFSPPYWKRAAGRKKNIRLTASPSPLACTIENTPSGSEYICTRAVSIKIFVSLQHQDIQ